MATALLMFPFAIATGAVGVGLFGLDAVEMLLGIVLGAVLWGVFYYLLDVHREVPDAETLRVAPADAEIPRRRLLGPRLLVLLAFALGVAWLAARWHLSGALVPGQMAGAAAAHLLGAILVGRWEREHGSQVLVRREGVVRPELYVASTVASTAP
jgi:hypothetical protein